MGGKDLAKGKVYERREFESALRKKRLWKNGRSELRSGGGNKMVMSLSR